MKTLKQYQPKLLAAVLIGLFAVSVSVFAARPPDAGNGGDSGNEPPDYGDLYILYRDVNGVPIITDYNEADNSGACQQPLAAEPFEGCLLPDGTSDINDPDCTIIPVDPTYCTVPLQYAALTQEPEFNRINEARSPEAVFEAQLEDVTTTLATAGCISLDPAGRLVASTKVIIDDSDPDNVISEVVTSTINSPLQNLAIYRQLMLEGTLGETIDEALEGLMGTGWQLDTAARGVGAAAGKDEWVGVDLTVYLNEIFGLTDQALSSPPMLLPNDTLCINVREEVKGVVEFVEKCFLDYSSYNYDFEANFSTESLSLPNPAYIPDGTSYGRFEYLTEVSPDTDPVTFKIEKGPILDAVPELDRDPAPGGEEPNIGGFAQAADDTRAVIEFMHTWPVPGTHPTPVPCDNEGTTFYDVSISDVSGLQVPERMTSGTWRGGSVTVHNDGPGVATGTIMVDRLMNGASFILYSEEPVEGQPLPPVIFDQPLQFELPADNDIVVNFYFTIESDTKTDIFWTATADAEDDVNLDNNVVEELTSVTKSNSAGGGGGH